MLTKAVGCGNLIECVCQAFPGTAWLPGEPRGPSLGHSRPAWLRISKSVSQPLDKPGRCPLAAKPGEDRGDSQSAEPRAVWTNHAMFSLPVSGRAGEPLSRWYLGWPLSLRLCGSWGCIPANAPAKLCKQTGRLVGQAHWLGSVSWPGSAMHSTVSSLRSHPERSSMNTRPYPLGTRLGAVALHIPERMGC